MSDLFGDGVLIDFYPHERAFLKHNMPGPSGVMGGYQNGENELLDRIPLGGGTVLLEPRFLDRLKRYCLRYGHGGPNDRIRKCCIEAFKRAGVKLQ